MSESEHKQRSTPEQRAELEALVPEVYQELRALARDYFRRQRAGFTLQPTEMVNEACLQLLERGSLSFENAQHFRAIATRKMWQVIVDHVRTRRALKRGGRGINNPESGAAEEIRTHRAGWQRMPIDMLEIEWRDQPVDVLDLADALEALGELQARLKDCVMLRWFAGLTAAETARELGVSKSTVEKDYRFALAWLNRRLQGEADGG